MVRVIECSIIGIQITSFILSRLLTLLLSSRRNRQSEVPAIKRDNDTDKQDDNKDKEGMGGGLRGQKEGNDSSDNEDEDGATSRQSGSAAASSQTPVPNIASVKQGATLLFGAVTLSNSAFRIVASEWATKGKSVRGGNVISKLIMLFL